ncbi:MAG: energy transducer TonB, partial [Cytophagaceae bacterium]|nr:energy transducer TonB [Cytophagaceae bacterium]
MGGPIVYKLLSGGERTIVVEEIQPDTIEIVDVPLEKTPDPLPIAKIEPIQLKEMMFVPPKPVDKEEVVDKLPPDNTKLDSANISYQDKAGKDSLGTLPPDVKIGNTDLTSNGDTEPWSGPVHKETGFPGGSVAMTKYISARMSQKFHNYLSENSETAIKVFLDIIIGEDGTIKSVQIKKGKEIANCKFCNEEIIEIFQSMPKWTPAENNGHPVPRKTIVPVKFQ